MKKHVDQMGRQVVAPVAPQRIISLVPSQTELLFDLGLRDQIVGVTKFCVHPADGVRQKQSVGGTKKFRFDIIDNLQPDLIIGNKEENYEEGIRQLAATYPVWMSDIQTLPDALAMIRAVGELVNRSKQAGRLADTIADSFTRLQPVKRPFRLAYFIWQKPTMVVGANTFINDMLTRCGFVNAFAGGGCGRYPEVTAEQIHSADLDAIFLSSEPFPFREKHRQSFGSQFHDVNIYLVDGQMFSWYGSRLRLAVDYFKCLIEPLLI